MTKPPFLFISVRKDLSKEEECLHRSSIRSQVAKFRHNQEKSPTPGSNFVVASIGPKKRKIAQKVQSIKSKGLVKKLDKQISPSLQADRHSRDCPGKCFELCQGTFQNRVDAQSKTFLPFSYSGSSTWSNLDRQLGNHWDAFSCIPGSQDPDVARTLYLFCQMLSPTYNTICYVFNITNVYATFVEHLEHKEFFHAAVAAMTEILQQHRQSDLGLSPVVLKHRGKAIATLRKALLMSTAAVSDITLYSIVFLAVLEWRTGNASACDLHRQNLALIVSRQGGHQALVDGSLAKALLMQYDTFWADPDSPPLFAKSQPAYRPVYPRIPYDRATQEVLNELPPGFQVLAIMSLLSYDVLRVIRRAGYAITAHLGSENPHFHESRLTLNDIWESCTCLSALDRREIILEKLVSLAVLVFCCIAFHRCELAPGFFWSARLQLKRKLALFQPKTRAEADVALWLWSITLTSWSFGNGGVGPEALLLKSAFHERFPRVNGRACVEERLQEFLWTPRLSNLLERVLH